MNFEKMWLFSVKAMSILGNLVLLQVFNIILILTGQFALVFPVIMIVNSIIIFEYIYNSNKFSFTYLWEVIKTNVRSIITYILIQYGLIFSLGLNQSMQKVVISNNYSLASEFLLLLFAAVILCTLITFTIFFPLVNTTSEQSLSLKIKTTFIVPFVSFKGLILILVSTGLNVLLVFTNMLFLIIFGPILLLSANIIIYRNYVTNKEEWNNEI
ncbi:hypothetical protein RZE82_04470 [Mollicutes bacterium LVI A0039]|nr:hypothetical protein RZE82_04470 [Mollicutes bacterium LVI A0039]